MSRTDGPQGPEGLPGPEGPAGKDFHNFVRTVTVKIDGIAAIDLPVGAGTAEEPPLVTGYLGNGSNMWLVLGTDISQGVASFRMIWMGSFWRAVVIGAPAGWLFRLVAAY